MLEVNATEHSAMMKIILHGKVTKEDIQRFEGEFKRKILEQEPINLLLIIKDWEGITLDGLMEDMKMVQYVKSIKKMAVVSDEKWVKADAKIENQLPGVQVVYYPPEEIQSGKNWLYA
ncbi:STAS/SEC14 domain-containing protein [Virgibacillus sp. SK37]|uniref:STAS/SEC14 domain-containing protein n=1 Tax=Virgibacillus sp. SK37 TaxID=403957 RepID=UPI0004D19D9A|nr:STAS/SEC14 domain-containing protein [Virgibacillus sp. SK37]AIF45526.1 hypothetical protein X953_15525 [Virgibacillus sp. SK37]